MFLMCTFIRIFCSVGSLHYTGVYNSLILIVCDKLCITTVHKENGDMELNILLAMKRNAKRS